MYSSNPLPHPLFSCPLEKKGYEKKFQYFLDMLKKLHINIPFVDALEQMPLYVKFLKDILSKRRRLNEFETMGKRKKKCPIPHTSQLVMRYAT